MGWTIQDDRLAEGERLMSPTMSSEKKLMSEVMVLARRNTRITGTTPAMNMALTPAGREEELRNRPTSPNTNPKVDIAIFDQLIFSSSKTGLRMIFRTS